VDQDNDEPNAKGRSWLSAFPGRAQPASSDDVPGRRWRMGEFRGQPAHPEAVEALRAWGTSVPAEAKVSGKRQKNYCGYIDPKYQQPNALAPDAQIFRRSAGRQNGNASVWPGTNRFTTMVKFLPRESEQPGLDVAKC